MPDIRSIVKNHALNRDRERRGAAGAGAASGAGVTPLRTFRVRAQAGLWPAGAKEELRPSLWGQSLTESLSSAGREVGSKPFQPLGDLPREGKKELERGTQDSLSLIHQRDRWM